MTSFYDRLLELSKAREEAVDPTQQADLAYAPFARVLGAITKGIAVDLPKATMEQAQNLEATDPETGERVYDPKPAMDTAMLTIGRVPGGVTGKQAAVGAAMLSSPQIANKLLTPEKAEAAPWDKAAGTLSWGNEQEQVPTQKVFLPTAGGPTEVSDKLISDLGVLGATTLGFMFAPGVAKNLIGQIKPKFERVPDAPEGLMGVSSGLDRLKTMTYDANAGLMGVLNKAGANAQEVKDVATLFTAQTRSGGDRLVRSGVENGEFVTPTARFTVQTPLREVVGMDVHPNLLNAKGNPEPSKVTEYLNINKTISDIRQANGAPVRGMDMATAQVRKQQFEQAYPEFVEVRKAVRENNKAAYDYAAEGEYGIYTPQKHNELVSSRLDDFIMPKEQARGFASENIRDTMQKVIQRKMENEAVGTYIDLLRKSNPSLVKQVDAATLNKNPQYQDKLVSFYRRGKKETYVVEPFIADTLAIDPFYFVSTLGQSYNAMKRVYESALTRELAPWFAVRNFLRTWQNTKLTTPPGRRSPGLLSSVYAIPQQLLPQGAQALSHWIDLGNSGWFRKVVGDQAADAVSRRLTKIYADSLVARIELHGSHQGSIMQDQWGNAWDKLKVVNVSGGVKPFWDWYKKSLNAVHNAPEFAYVAKNKRPLTELVQEAADIAGSPRITGQFTTKNVSGRGNAPIRGRGGKLVTGIGRVAEFGRTSVPFFNPTVSGVRRMAQAYWKNPINFTTKLYAYVVLPEVMRNLYTRSLGTDPNGVNYYDYERNGRSEYRKLMFTYLPIPGRPVAEAIEIPRVHEVSIVSALTAELLDHALHTNQDRSGEYKKLLQQWLGVVFDPSLPVPGPQVISAIGYNAPQGVGALVGNLAGRVMKETGMQLPEWASAGGSPFGGEGVWKPREHVAHKNLARVEQGLALNSVSKAGAPIAEARMVEGAVSQPNTPIPTLPNTAPGLVQQDSGLPTAIETLLHGWAPSVGTLVGVASTAYSDDKGDFLDKVGSAMKAAGKRSISQADIIGSLSGLAPPRAGNTELMTKYHQKKDAIRYLHDFVGKHLPKDASPEFAQIADAIYKQFQLDAPKGGGQGFQSMLRHISHDTKLLDTLRRVSTGNEVKWHEEMKKRPEIIGLLKQYKVDPNNLTAVKNFYERKRQQDLRVVLNAIEEVEKKLGVKIEDVKPF